MLCLPSKMPGGPEQSRNRFVPSMRNELGGSGSPLDIGSVFRVLLSRSWLIGGLTLGAATLALILTVLFPAKYTATAIVLLDPREARVTDTREVLPGIGSDASAVESQVELVRSPVLARKVIDELGLSSDPDFASDSIFDDLKQAIGFGQLTAKQQENLLIEKFEEALDVKRRGLTYVLEISFSSSDPDQAARIANAVAEAYIEGQRDLRADLTKGASQWLDEQIESMRQRVRKSEQVVADFKAENDLVDVTQGNQLIERRMEDVSQQLALAQARKAEVGARLQEVQAAARGGNAAEALSEILKSDTMTSLRDQYANAAQLEAQYRVIYGAQHPFLVSSRERLNALQRQIDQEVARVLQGLRTEEKAASQQQAALTAELDSLKEQSEKLRQASVPLAELQRQAEAERAVLTQYLGRLQETSREQSLQFQNARLISPALAPLSPSRPRKAILMLAAAVAGGIAGIALALFLEQSRRGLVSPSEVEQVLGLPYFGTLPDLHRGKSLLRPQSWFEGGDRRAENPKAQAEYARTVSAIARRLRRSATKDGEIVVVTSALPGEGKSTFIANLARASAAVGASTLLVDGDGYSGRVTQMFGVSGPGLKELVQEREMIRGIGASDVSSGLYVIGTGSMLGAQFNHLDERAVSAVLNDFRKSFDVIMVDSPAMLPTGGRMIECADRIVLISEWGRTDRTDVIDALELMGPHEANVAGVVLTKVPFDERSAPSSNRLYSSEVYAAGTAPLHIPREV